MRYRVWLEHCLGFHVTLKFSSAIRFDNWDTKTGCHQQDQLAIIEEVWEKWIEYLQIIYNPDTQIVVDECVVTLRGRTKGNMWLDI